MKDGLSREDKHYRSKWILDINQIAISLQWIWSAPFVGDTTGFKT